MTGYVGKRSMSSKPLRIGIVADLVEEGWPSMDLVAEVLMTELARPGSPVTPVLLRPEFRSRVGRWMSTDNGRARTIDRIINRFHDYPRWLRARREAADVFHLIDHSYAHLVDELPAGRVVVTCHDTDAFRPLVHDGLRESRLPHRMVRRVLTGLRHADIVTCVSETTRRDLVGTGLVPLEHTEVVLNGVHPSCSPAPDAAADNAARALLGPVTSPELLHVGSTIPRKRVDVLLRAFKAVVSDRPDVRLVRVGGPFTPAQERLASELGITSQIVVLPFLERPVLAAVYRRAALLLQPSEREGFGLPIVEAMACGTPVVATDLPVLREVGGDAVSFVSLEDIQGWQIAIEQLLDQRSRQPAAWESRRTAAISRAAMYSWARFAQQMTGLYARLAEGNRAEAALAAR